MKSKNNKESKGDKKRLGRFFKTNNKRKEDAANEAESAALPRITNETVTQHREEVLGGARKYKYPLRQSRHKIVVVSVALLVAVIIGFTSYVLLNLYKFQSTSTFMYKVTRAVPFPVARVGRTFVSYEDYLFEIRHYIHYFESQQDVDFNSEQGKAQLADQRKKSLEKVVNQAYIKRIAKEKNITVSRQEIDAQIDILRTQNRLGGDSKVFEDVLKDYWGWTVSDFRRSIEQEILSQKVLRALDTGAKARADAAYAELKAGKSFADVSKAYSDDGATKDKGGELGFLVSKTDRNIPPQTINALFKLKTGEYSPVTDIGWGLEIVKNLGFEGDKIKAARIFISYQDINNFLNSYKEKQKAHTFIRVND